MTEKNNKFDEKYISICEQVVMETEGSHDKFVFQEIKSKSSERHWYNFRCLKETIFAEGDILIEKFDLSMQ